MSLFRPKCGGRKNLRAGHRRHSELREEQYWWWQQRGVSTAPLPRYQTSAAGTELVDLVPQHSTSTSGTANVS